MRILTIMILAIFTCGFYSSKLHLNEPLSWHKEAIYNTFLHWQAKNTILKGKLDNISKTGSDFRGFSKRKVKSLLGTPDFISSKSKTAAYVGIFQSNEIWSYVKTSRNNQRELFLQLFFDNDDCVSVFTP